MIRHLIFRMGGDADDAKDIFQDGLAILINMADDPKYELRSSVKTLLYAVCRNQWQYRLREIRRTVPLQKLDQDPAGKNGSIDHLMDISERLARGGLIVRFFQTGARSIFD